jgi:hypothetical protein
MPIVNEKPLIEILSPEEQHDRFDINYYLPEFIHAERYIENCDIELTTLGDVMTDDVSYGVLPPSSSYLEEGGISLVRSSNVSNSGIDYESAVRVPSEWISSERARIKSNDVLISVKGARAFFDMCVASDNPPDAIVNGSIFRFQCKEDYDPKFVVLWLLSKPIQSMVFRERANLGISYISSGVLHNIPFPKISKEHQQSIVRFISASKDKIDDSSQREFSKVYAVKSYINNLNKLFENELGLPPVSQQAEKKIFLAAANAALDRLDTSFNQPAHIKLLNALKSCCPKHIGDFLKISASRIDGAAIQHFIGMEHVEAHTGKAIIEDCEPNAYGTSMQVFDNSLLYGRLRPYLNKVVFVEGCEPQTGCSTEFYVCKNDSKLLTRVIAYYIRSSYGLMQLRHLPAGGALPRVSTDDFLSVLCPDFSSANLDQLIEKIGQIEATYQQALLVSSSYRTKIEDISRPLSSDVLMFGKIETQNAFTNKLEEALQ